MLATPDQFNAMVSAFERGVRLEFRKGEFIIRPGDTPQGVFYIESGQVKAFDITKYGEENMLIVRKEREIFPLIWALTGQERQVIYQALVPTAVWRISRKDFLNYFQEPSHALAPLLDMTIEMYRIHSERIINLEYRTVRERLVSYLITMSQRFGEEDNQNIIIKVPMRQQDIASSISATRETTSRELSMLEKHGLVKAKPPYVIICDMKKLKSFLE